MGLFWNYETNLPDGTGYKLFGIEHFFMIVLVIISCLLVVYKYNRTEAYEKRIKIKSFFANSAMALLVARIVYLLIGGYMSVYELPLHLCSIAGILCFIDIYSHKKWIKVVLYSVCLPGLVLAIIFPNGNMYPLCSFISIQSYMFHAITIIYILLFVNDREIKASIKNIGISCMFLMLIVPVVLILDVILECNYMFLRIPSAKSPLVMLYNGTTYIGYLTRYAILVLMIISLMNIILKLVEFYFFNGDYK